MGRKVTEDEIEQWLALKKRGYTNKAIGEKFGRAEKTIGEHLREYLKRKGEEGSPPDSELEMLKRQEEVERLFTALEEAREARLKVPNRLDDVEKTLKAYEDDVERLRLKLKSQPDFSKLRCTECGEYMAVEAVCMSCNHKYWFGLWGEK